jgi:SAM-dependent methyltransferase
MRYFQAHEAIYANRLATGATGWDDGPYDAFALREQVQTWLAASPAAKPGGAVLELGCGTGALACSLATLGFAVTGLDISESAIAFARAKAGERGLPVRFEVADACAWQVQGQPFDVVIDSHLLHCIVRPAERRQVLERVAGCLTRSGEFWTETMTIGTGLQDTPTRRLDPDGIVWAATPDPSGCCDAVRNAAGWWTPMRYIAPTAESLIEEFGSAGLDVIEWHLVPPSASGEAADFRARLRRHRDAG